MIEFPSPLCTGSAFSVLVESIESSGSHLHRRSIHNVSPTQCISAVGSLVCLRLLYATTSSHSWPSHIHAILGLAIPVLHGMHPNAELCVLMVLFFEAQPLLDHWIIQVPDNILAHKYFLSRDCRYKWISWAMSSSVMTDLMCLPYRLTGSWFLSSRNCHVHACREGLYKSMALASSGSNPDADVQSMPVPST